MRVDPGCLVANPPTALFCLYKDIFNVPLNWQVGKYCVRCRIGCTEFLLRYIAWSCLEFFAPNTRVCIVTGPRIDLAEDLIARFKGLFSQITENLISDRTASTVAIVNGVKVEA